MITYNDLYQKIRRRLKQEEYPSAGLEARELICYASKKTREEFFRDMRLYVPAGTEAAVWSLVDRHIKGEPVAYLIGEWDFFGLTLYVTKDVLIPRVDTEVLAQEAIRFIQTLGSSRILDLCAGSGCIGLAIAANVDTAELLLGEISEQAVQICRRNIRRCGLENRVSVQTMDALQPPPETLGKFHCIVCNPPYIPDAEITSLDHSVKEYEPILALSGGEDGCCFFRAVTQYWRRALLPGGRLFFEVGIGQADMVRKIMQAEGFAKIQVIPDGRNIPRVICGVGALPQTPPGALPLDPARD